jgi:hypothetical protein
VPCRPWTLKAGPAEDTPVFHVKKIDIFEKVD